MQKFASVFFLIALACLIYLPFVRNQLFWDDEQFIYNNQYVRQFSIAKIFTTNTIAGAGELSNYFRPLTTLSFAIDYQFWGNNPIGYHLVNLLLHASAAVVLYVLLRALGLPKLASLVVSAFFISHPLQTEAVAYANSRGDSFFALLGLCSLVSFVQSLKKRVSSLTIYDLRLSISPARWALLSSIFYLLAILAKEIGIAIVGLQLLVAITWHLRTGLRLSRSAITVLISNALIAASYLLLRFTVLQFQPQLNLYDPAEYGAYGTSVGVRLLTFSKVVWIYACLILLPYPLHMERSTDVVSSLWSAWPWLTTLFVAIVAWLGWRERKQFKTMWIWFGSGWFALMLAPVSGLLPINGMLYEHWLYTPLIGFFLAAYGVLKLANIPGGLVKAVVAGVIIVYVMLSWRQNYLWANPIRFYSYTLQFSRSARLHNNLAMALASVGSIEQAITQYQAALSINDAYPQTHHNLANAYRALNRLDEAERQYLRAIEMDRLFSPAYLSLIKLYEHQKRPEDAAKLKSQFLSVFPD